MRNKLTIGSRGSLLALTQTKQFAARLAQCLPGVDINIEVISTKGDRIVDTPLAQIGGKGLFTKELETALLEKQVDLAVHSLKDLPTELPAGLALGAIPPRENPNDALISVKYKSLDDLPQGSVVGTSSLRRRAQLLTKRPDLDIRDLRGNIDTRMKKVADGQYDAAILACAGIIRLGKQDAITQELHTDIMISAAAQGALGIEIREDDNEMRMALFRVHDTATEIAVSAERSLLDALGGGCQIPLGARAFIDDDELILRSCVCSTDGKQVVGLKTIGSPQEPEKLGQKAAEEFHAQGAHEIIEEAYARAAELNAGDQS